MATMTRPQTTVVETALAHGWRATWQHRLLHLSREANGTTYRVQVLFDEAGRWDYALTFSRQGAYESETRIVARRRDLFAHLADPVARTGPALAYLRAGV